VSDVLYDYSTSRIRRLDAIDPEGLGETFGDLEENGRERLAEEAFGPEEMRFERTLDLRYAGQAFELSVSVPKGTIEQESIETIAERFHDRHRQRYGHAYPEEAIELVTIRLRARGVVDTPTLGVEERGGSIDDAIRETRTVIYSGEAYDTRIYDGDRLPIDATFDGPAVVEGAESTTVVPPTQRVHVDEYANLLIKVFPSE
jgi:N-methylhydantoinase A